MKAITKKINGIEFVINGKIKVSSLDIADRFDKRHSDVMRAISNMDCSSDFTERNFALSEYKDKSGKSNSCFNMTRDGFAYLAMGFTGKAAALWKERFIEAFNAMEQYILEEKQRAVHDNTARLECPAMTLALKEARQDEGKDTKPHHYSNEHNLIYRIILGVTKKKWCDENDIDKKERFRDHLPTPIIEAVEELQRVNTSMIEMGFEYQERKKRLDKLYTKKYLGRCLQAIVDDNL